MHIYVTMFLDVCMSNYPYISIYVFNIWEPENVTHESKGHTWSALMWGKPHITCVIYTAGSNMPYEDALLSDFKNDMKLKITRNKLLCPTQQEILPVFFRYFSKHSLCLWFLSHTGHHGVFHDDVTRKESLTYSRNRERT